MIAFRHLFSKTNAKATEKNQLIYTIFLHFEKKRYSQIGIGLVITFVYLILKL